MLKRKITLGVFMALGLQSALMADISAIQKDALVALYNTTGGSTWQSNENWLSGDPCTNNWKGISCNSDETSVTKVLLYDNNLSGEIPSELSALTDLTYLSLGGNSLVGEIPTSLGSLSQLTDLRLYDNRLSGQIPTEISKLTELTTLNLRKNELNGNIPSELSKLSNLNTLNLGENQLSGNIPTQLANLTNLETLKLYRNCLDGTIPSELGALKNLTYLTVGNNKLSGTIPNELGELLELKDLRLYSNQLTGAIPKSLGELLKLKSLHLYNNQLSSAIPHELGNLSEIISLKLGKNQLVGAIPKSFGTFPKIEELYLERNELNGFIPEEIKSLTTLKCLRVYKNRNLKAKSDELKEFIVRTPKCFNNVFYTPACQCSDNSELTNLIKNGSFEEFTVDKDHGNWKEVTLTHWNTIGEIWTNSFGTPATDGEFKNELDAGRELNVLNQMVQTETGKSYQLSLDIYARKTGSSDVEVWIDDNKLATIKPKKQWKSYLFSFIGNGENQRVELREVASQNDTYGALLDNIVLIKKCKMVCSDNSNLVEGATCRVVDTRR